MRELADAQAMTGRTPRAARFAAYLFVCVLPLLGAAAPGALPAPAVVVYPLTSTGPSASETGSNVAVVLATKLAELGGLTLIPYTPGTARANYLDAARKQDADYYITGYMTPVGAEVSLIVQAVSTTSGSVIYSATTMARTYADAANQADTLRDAIVRHAGRGLPSLGAPPAASASPTPNSGDAGSVNLTKALGRKRRKPSVAQTSPTPAATKAAQAAAAAPIPPATPAASAAASPNAGKGSSTQVVAALERPLRGSRRLVLQVDGPADPAARTYAANALAAALRRGGATSGVLPVTRDEAAAHLADICKANPGTQALYAGTLSVQPGPKNARGAVLDLAAFTCDGASLPVRRGVASATGRGDPTFAAIDRATNDALQVR